MLLMKLYNDDGCSRIDGVMWVGAKSTQSLPYWLCCACVCVLDEKNVPHNVFAQICIIDRQAFLFLLCIVCHAPHQSTSWLLRCLH
jgi:hypothetical protein